MSFGRVTYGDELSAAIRNKDKETFRRILKDGHMKGAFGRKKSLDLTKAHRIDKYSSYLITFTNILGLAVASKQTDVMTELIEYMKKEKIPLWVSRNFQSVHFEHPFFMALAYLPTNKDHEGLKSFLTKIYEDEQSQEYILRYAVKIKREIIDLLLEKDMFPLPMQEKILEGYLLSHYPGFTDLESFLKALLVTKNRPLIKKAYEILITKKFTEKNYKHLPFQEFLGDVDPTPSVEPSSDAILEEQGRADSKGSDLACEQTLRPSTEQVEQVDDIVQDVVKNIVDEIVLGHVSSDGFEQDAEKDEQEQAVTCFSIEPKMSDLECPNCNHCGISTCRNLFVGDPDRPVKKISSPQFTLRGRSYYFDPSSNLDQLCQFYGYQTAVEERVLPDRYPMTNISQGKDKLRYVVQMNEVGRVDLVESKDGAYIKNWLCCINNT
jgi:hypothetical protein